MILKFLTKSWLVSLKGSRFAAQKPWGFSIASLRYDERCFTVFDINHNKNILLNVLDRIACFVFRLHVFLLFCNNGTHLSFSFLFFFLMEMKKQNQTRPLSDGRVLEVAARDWILVI